MLLFYQSRCDHMYLQGCENLQDLCENLKCNHDSNSNNGPAASEAIVCIAKLTKQLFTNQPELCHPTTLQIVQLDKYCKNVSTL